MLGSTIDLTSLSGTIALNSRIRIDDNLTITGPGANSLTVSGQSMTRIFFIGGGTVSISGLTLANGVGSGAAGAAGGSAAGMGGAIFMNGGAVNLTGVSFSGNSAQGTRALINAYLGGAGIGGGSIGFQGGPGGDLFGMGGNGVTGGTGGTGGLGAGGGFPSGSGGFAGGGGAGGNGGFGGGGGGTDTYDNGTVSAGTGGYGAAAGASAGGASAGFGGAIFEFAGVLTLVNDTFTGNSAMGGVSNTGNGQGKGGALFVYNGATAYNNGSTFTANTAPDAGSPGIGNSAAPYVNGATCPGEDDADICGNLSTQPAATLAVAVTAAGGFKQGATAEWDVTVSNAASSIATSAAVSMQDTLPAGYAVSGFGSTDVGTWTCSGAGTQTAICSATAQIAGGQAYPLIHLLVNVPATSALSITNTALAFGGGDPVHINVSTAAKGSSVVTVAQVAANIAVLGGTTPQSAAVGTQFAQPLTVVVTDAGGNPAPGVTVAFSAPPLGASAALSAPSPTDSNGLASVKATADSILGNYGVTAILSGINASATFALTNVYNGTPPPPTACVAAPANLTAWWKGDGNFSDVTGSFNAAAGGDVSFGIGEVGQAFSFDGTLSPSVTIPSTAFPYPASSAFSFETWFSTKHGGVIIGLQSAGATPYATPPNYTPGIYVGTDGKLYAQMFYNQSIQQSVSSGVVNDGSWHHVAVTYDGSNQIAYLDGAQIGLLANFAESADGSAPYQIQLGTGFTNTSWPNGSNGWYTFNGLIDEAAVYARALSASEVQGVYFAGAYGKCDPAVSLSSPLSFGNVREGGNATQSATLSNPGNAPLTITAIALDAGDTNFSVLSGNAGDCAVGTPVAAAGSCNIRVSFAPLSSGSMTGSVTVTDNSLYLGGTQTMQLQGTGSAIKLSAVSGSGQSAAVGTQFVAPLVIQVTDSQGNPVSGATVIFSAPTSGASAKFSTPKPTDVNGHASVVAKANAVAGTYTVTASVNSVTTTFSLTNLPTVTFLTLKPSAGNNVVNTPYTLSVEATGAGAVPVPNTTVTFTVTAGPNAGVTGTSVTGSNGQTSFTYSGGSTPGTDTVQASSGQVTSSSVSVNWQAVPVITWATPSGIVYGTALSAKQLDAKANVAGTYTYMPAAGTILTAGSQQLSVKFTPTNTKLYTSASGSVTLQVAQATPTVTWAPASLTYGTPLGSAQLDAIASVPGTFTYTPTFGVVLTPGNQQLSAVFTPSDTTDYNTVNAKATLVVQKATAVIIWNTPAPIKAGTPLGAMQLDATANVPGTFTYNPPAGTVLAVGTHSLGVHFTPQNTSLYNGASDVVQITVQQ